MLSLGMRGEEVPQDHEKFACVLLVAAAQRVMDIVAHHVADLRGSVRFFQQVAADGCGGDFWNVFVFRDREHLFLCQAAEGDTILKADHA